ncbi:Scr1 family TA system antitoxin-like transcriptional regulator [Saccharopolyspora spinosa]|uniref:Scr1 family TA system antitoxin-like transcriptional regulator n=1 Tax=Saccharopolyspora spinosa TaxID=60894 RepID=UPI003B435863
MPIRSPFHPGTAGPFTIYEFPDGPPFVHFEHFSGEVFVTESGDIDTYRKAIDTMCSYAINFADSAKLIAKIMVEEHGSHDRDSLAQKFIQ